MNPISEKLWWVGTRLADLQGISQHFAGAIVVASGTPSTPLEVLSLEEQTGERLNHNSKNNLPIFDSFFSISVRNVLSTYKKANFIFYSTPPKDIFSDLSDRIPYNISTGLFNICNDKDKFRRKAAHRGLRTVKFKVLPADTLKELSPGAVFKGAHRLVAQERTGFGGHQTFLLPGGEHLLQAGHHYLTAPFIDGGVPVNIHIVVFREGPPVIFPGSVQLIEEIGGRLLYVGGDFGLFSQLPEMSRRASFEAARECGKLLQSLGYRGVAGVDLLLDDTNDPLFIEVNPRFQSSSPLLNSALAKKGVSTVFDMHLEAFRTPGMSNADFRGIPISASFFTPLFREGFAPLKFPDGPLSYDVGDTRATEFSGDGLKAVVISDSSYPIHKREEESVLARLHFPTSIAGLSPARDVQIQPAILRSGYAGNDFSNLARNEIGRIARLKFMLFSLGMRISQSARSAILRHAESLTIRDGAAGGLEIRLFDDIYINVPVKEGFVAFSPFELTLNEDNNFALMENGAFVGTCKLPLQHLFWGRKFGAVEGLNTIGHINTDRLGLFPFRSCKYSARDGTACQFCEIGYSKAYAKVPTEDAARLVRRCEANIPQVRHILVSGGVGPDANWHYYVRFIESIRQETAKPIYQMIEPPPSLAWIDELHGAGVTEIGLNMEVCNPERAREIMPGKGAIPREKYFDALEHAVGLWGGEGAVRSIILVGLEPIDDTLEGVRSLASRGVMPILSPFRPVPATGLANCPPPVPELLYRIWSESQALCESAGMTLGPLCVACQNNTVSLPVSDAYRAY